MSNDYVEQLDRIKTSLVGNSITLNDQDLLQIGAAATEITKFCEAVYGRRYGPK